MCCPKTRPFPLGDEEGSGTKSSGASTAASSSAANDSTVSASFNSDSVVGRDCPNAAATVCASALPIID